MTKSRRRFKAEFNFGHPAGTRLEAAKGVKTLNELSSQFGVHPNQISEWKRELLEGGPTVFSNPAMQKLREQETLQEELYAQIGRLKTELEWLKKLIEETSDD